MRTAHPLARGFSSGGLRKPALELPDRRRKAGYVSETTFARHITATPDTFFQLPEIAMGLIPGAGGCVSIPRRIGRQRTNWLAMTGEQLDAEQALAWGLVDRLVEHWNLES